MATHFTEAADKDLRIAVGWDRVEAILDVISVLCEQDVYAPELLRDRVNMLIGAAQDELRTLRALVNRAGV